MIGAALCMALYSIWSKPFIRRSGPIPFTTLAIAVGSLAAAGKHLQAMLQSVDTISPALHDFYDSLSDDQKARFNTLGKQLFADNQQPQQ